MESGFRAEGQGWKAGKPFTRKRTPLQIQKNVLYALFLRELRTRFGHYKIGYVWAFLEPVLHIAFFYCLFHFFGRKTYAQIDLPLFLVTGIIPWLMFRSIVNNAMHAVKANSGLFAYHHVKPLDAILARALLEVAIYLVAYTLLILISFFLGCDISIKSPLSLMYLWSLYILFCLSVGIIMAVAYTYVHELEKLIVFIFRLFYVSSGIFFTLESVPLPVRKFVAINPIIHFIELFRADYFANFTSEAASPLYVFVVTMALLFFSLQLYRVNQVKMIKSQDHG